MKYYSLIVMTNVNNHELVRNNSYLLYLSIVLDFIDDVSLGQEGFWIFCDFPMDPNRVQ